MGNGLFSTNTCRERLACPSAIQKPNESGVRIIYHNYVSHTFRQRAAAYFKPTLIGNGLRAVPFTGRNEFNVLIIYRN